MTTKAVAKIRQMTLDCAKDLGIVLTEVSVGVVAAHVGMYRFETDPDTVESMIHALHIGLTTVEHYFKLIPWVPAGHVRGVWKGFR